MMFMMAEIGIH